jgi:hypothetical protein
MKKILHSLIFLLLTYSASAQVSLEYYLPKNVTYNPQIPKPKDVLGFEIGEWHLSHDQLVNYFKALAAASGGRMTYEVYAYTYENRPLMLFTLTSLKNQAKIEELRQQHLDLNNPQKSGSLNTESMPIVVWLGNSVHGNEPSGANSGPLTAYYLLAAQGEAIEKMLDNTIILIDPSINPDGMQRFSTWVNMHKSKTTVSDPQSREFNEAAPRGRTNHYWFDLNRDWLPLQHPESKGRIKKYHHWRPNILTDHHEMGTNATFFFQPGVPSRQNPLTPGKNFELTAQIAQFHAQALDSIQSLYYTKEGFDDFYYGKGSSYPDIHGAVGILFEQASSRGHAQESSNGLLTFPFTVKNQFNAALSTLRAAQAMRKQMLDYQREFYQNLPAEKGGYVFSAENDPARVYHFNEMLQLHQIDIQELTQDLSAEGKKFKKNKSYYVSLNQSQQKLIKTIFETQTKFQDSLFYDISTWTFPLAFDLTYSKLAIAPEAKKLEKVEFPKGKLVGQENKIGYFFKWEHYYAPRAANRLLNKGLKIRTVTQKTVFKVQNESVELDYGTILIPFGIQNMPSERVWAMMQELAEKDGVDIYSLSGGLAENGPDLGSANMRPLARPSVAAIMGDNVENNDVGEVWHLLDQRYEMPLTMLDFDRLSSANLQRYNTLVLVSGSYSNMSSTALENLKTWLRQGNTLIAIGSANNWLKANNLASDLALKTPPKEDSTRILPYADKDKLSGAQILAGSIFEGQLDTTHPLAYGFKNQKISVFRDNTIFVKKPNSPYQSPLLYSKNPLLSGYVSKQNLAQIKESAGIVVSFYGQGRVISMIDNPNFRAFWYGTNKLFANALFFSRFISR